MAWLWSSVGLGESVSSSQVEGADLWSSQVQKFVQQYPGVSFQIDDINSRMKELYAVVVRLKNEQQKIFDGLFLGDYSVDSISSCFDAWGAKLSSNLKLLSQNQDRLQDLQKDVSKLARHDLIPLGNKDLKTLQRTFFLIDTRCRRLLALTKDQEFRNVCQWNKKVKIECLNLNKANLYSSTKKVRELVMQAAYFSSKTESALDPFLQGACKQLSLEGCLVTQQVFEDLQSTLAEYEFQEEEKQSIQIEIDFLKKTLTDTLQKLQLDVKNISHALPDENDRADVSEASLAELKTKVSNKNGYYMRLSLWFPRIQERMGWFEETWPSKNSIEAIGQATLALGAIVDNLLESIECSEKEDLSLLRKDCDVNRDYLLTLHEQLEKALADLCRTGSNKLAHDIVKNSTALFAIMQEIKENLLLLYAMTSPLYQEAYLIEHQGYVHLRLPTKSLESTFSFHSLAERIHQLGKLISEKPVDFDFIQNQVVQSFETWEEILASNLLQVTFLEEHAANTLWEKVMRNAGDDLPADVRADIVKRMTRVMYATSSKACNVELELMLFNLKTWLSSQTDQEFLNVLAKYEKRAREERLETEHLLCLRCCCKLMLSAKYQHDPFAFDQACFELLRFCQNFTKSKKISDTFTENLFEKLSSVAKLQNYFPPALPKERLGFELVKNNGEITKLAKEQQKMLYWHTLSSCIWGVEKKLSNDSLDHWLPIQDLFNPFEEIDFNWLLRLNGFLRILHGRVVGPVLNNLLQMEEQTRSLLPIAENIQLLLQESRHPRTYARTYQLLHNYREKYKEEKIYQPHRQTIVKLLEDKLAEAALKNRYVSSSEELFKPLCCLLWGSFGTELAEKQLMNLLNSPQADQFIEYADIQELLNECSARKIVKGELSQVTPQALDLLKNGVVEDYINSQTEPVWLHPVIFRLIEQEELTKTDEQQHSLKTRLIKKWGLDQFKKTRSFY